MSLINTNTRVVRPTPEIRLAVAEGRLPDVPARREPGRHRPIEERPTRVITATVRAAVRTPAPPTPPDEVEQDTTRLVGPSTRPGVLARIRANVGRFLR